MKQYHELPIHVQAYLHSIELHACIHTWRQLDGYDETRQFIQNRVHTFTTPEKWQDEINAFYMVRAGKPLDQAELIFYYLTAGCGINKIQKLLNVGQATVYKVKNNEDYSRKHTTLEEMFLTDPSTIDGLQLMTDHLQLLDGQRVASNGVSTRRRFTGSHEKFVTPEEFITPTIEGVE